MHLRELDSQCIHLSHFHKFVSAYESSKEMVEDLAEDIRMAVKKAKETKEAIIVCQDNSDHVFIVWPRGSISLMAERKRFEILEEA